MKPKSIFGGFNHFLNNGYRVVKGHLNSREGLIKGALIGFNSVDAMVFYQKKSGNVGKWVQIGVKLYISN